MALKIGEAPKNSNKDFGRLEEGTHVARLVQVIDLGQQVITNMQGEERVVPRAWIVFEFPTETIEINGEERPRWQGKEYTISYHEKSGLTQVINSLDPEGKAKHLGDLLGKACMVSIGSTSTGKAKITNVVPAPKKMAIPELDNPAKVFDFENPDMEVFETLPDWLKNKITTAENFKGSKVEEMLNSSSAPVERDIVYDDDESPFDDEI